MSALLTHRLALLAKAPHLPLLNQCLHGIERECLRVDAHGHLAMTPHPIALGSALTHPQITTDYSEALLEFITGTDGTLAIPWPSLKRSIASPTPSWVMNTCGVRRCLSAAERSGHPHRRIRQLNIGRLKHVYRQGLALRYGKTMQCIAGIHYNFSLPEALWPVLQADDGDTRSERDYRSARYIGLIRNFRRYSWLLMYLFGASPALDAGFLRGRPHQLEALDADTLYLPYATSLRMSDLGYQNNAQAGLTPCYDDLSSYTESLYRAVSTPYAPYEAMGIKDAAGNWQQLNTNVLQIENEYYSNIRPKRVTATGERPLQALRARGINTSKCAASISTRSCRWASTSTKHASSTPSFCSARWPTALHGRWRVRRGHRQLPQGGQEGRRPGCSCSTAARPSRSASGPASCSTRSPKSPPCSTAAMATAGMPKHWPNSAPRSPTAA